MSPVVGVAWYARDAWTRLRAVVPDAAALEERYEEWFQIHANGLADLRRTGLTPERVEIDAEVFLRWCEPLGLAPDSGARARYTADELRRRHEAGRHHPGA